MITIPNLFGAYQKGREAAIEANWNDLKNYENIEAMRTRNDRDALQHLADQADYNINRSMMRDNGDVSAMATALTRERFPGDVYNARIDSMLGEAQYGTARTAAADGTLSKLTDNWFRTTANNAGTNAANSWTNLIDADARQKGLTAHEDAYRQFVKNTVGYNLAKGQDVFDIYAATRDYDKSTAIYNSSTTAKRAQMADLFNTGKLQNPNDIVQAGVYTTEANRIGAQALVAGNQNTLTLTQDQLAEGLKIKLAQLQDQRTLLLQDIQLAAQSGNTAAVKSMSARYNTINAEIERLTGESQPDLVSEAAAGALLPPATQTPPQVPPQVPPKVPPKVPTKVPTQVPQQLLTGQQPPSFTPNGMDPRNAALSNLFINGAPANPNRRGGAGGLTDDDWTRLANNAGVGFTGGYW